MATATVGEAKKGHGAAILLEVGTLKAELAEVKGLLRQLLDEKAAGRDRKEWYSTDEAAKLLGRTPFCVREWCRHGRVKAEKRSIGHGLHREWAISHEELQRYRNHGLLPLAKAGA